MTKLKKVITVVAVATLAFTSCTKEDKPEPKPETPVIVNEEEVITTLIYTLTPSNGGAEVILKFQDLDGDGGDAPIITADTLAAGVTYSGKLSLLNEQESPAEDITAEIRDEDEDHQFFFLSTTSLHGFAVQVDDNDSNNKPVGLETTVSSHPHPVSGFLKITLIHGPNKSATGVSGGDITNAGGSSDIEVSFPIIIQ